MTLQKAIDDVIAAFSKAGMDQPQFEARQLVQECLGFTFAQLVSDPERKLEPGLEHKLFEWRDRRLAGEPLAYLSGHKGFYKYDFAVKPGVLIPRPETELVVETALRRIDEYPGRVQHVADLGCGSGCIGLSLAAELSDLHLWAVDSSFEACALTLTNAEQLGISPRVKVDNSPVESWQPTVQLETVVANPPYIPDRDPRVEAAVVKYEPKEALFAGEDGLESLRLWSEWAGKHLQKNGIFVCEFGAGQGRSVQDIVAKHGFHQIQTERDLAGHDRVISAIKVR